jgi:hypothetical protein
MKIFHRVTALLLLLQVGSICAPGSEVIERIVASVNRHVILESELRVAMAYQCLVNQSSCHPDDAGERKAALDRLIDQRLIEQQMEQSQFSPPAEMPEAVANLREQIMGKANSDADWSNLLRKHQLTEQDLAREASREVRILRFVDSRFRANLHIEEGSIENYYRNVLVKQLDASGAQVPTLTEVAGRIREVLAQLEMNRELAVWLQSLREQSTVRVR